MTKRSKQWKAFESRVAKDFGLRRVPTSGSNSGVTSADAMLPDPTTGKAPVYIECKYRGDRGDGQKTWPHGSLWYESKKKADKEGIPVVMLAHGDKHRNGYMITVHSSQLLDFVLMVLKHYKQETANEESEHDDADQTLKGSDDPERNFAKAEPGSIGP